MSTTSAFTRNFEMSSEQFGGFKTSFDVDPSATSFDTIITTVKQRLVDSLAAVPAAAAAAAAARFCIHTDKLEDIISPTFGLNTIYVCDFCHLEAENNLEFETMRY